MGWRAVRSRSVARGVLAAIGSCLAACRASAPATVRYADAVWHGEAWPEADALFRRDPEWRGGDGASSVDLGDERTLWLFGDSFVARPGSEGRRGCAMVRNSIAVQHGRNPATASMTFHWRGTRAEPASWFGEDGEVWHWPLGAARVGAHVLVFCTRVRRTGDGIFGFRACGWTVFVLAGVDGPPATWSVQPLRALPQTPEALVVGTAVVVHGDHLYAYALREPGDHAVHVLRWPLAQVVALDLRAPEWFVGGVWRHGCDAPGVVLAEGAPEFSVSPCPGGFALVQSVGFGATDLGLRRAGAPQGPWGPAEVVFRPPESDREGVFVYAGKAHPQLAGADLVATYASNAFDFGQVVADASLYFPRCVRLWRRRLPAPRE